MKQPKPDTQPYNTASTRPTICLPRQKAIGPNSQKKCKHTSASASVIREHIHTQSKRQAQVHVTLQKE